MNLFDSLGRDDRIFIRPDSPLTLFTGQIAGRNTFSVDLEFMRFHEFPVNSLVVVSSPKTILKEWRFVVADGKVVAGSQYKDGDALEYQDDFDDSALELAKSIAAADTNPIPFG